MKTSVKHTVLKKDLSGYKTLLQINYLSYINETSSEWKSNSNSFL